MFSLFQAALRPSTKKFIEIVYDLLIELNTGTLFSFPADWKRQILKLVLELVLVLDC